MLYRREFGSIPVEVTGNHTLLGLDVAAAWTADRRALTVALVNPSAEPKTIAVAVEGAQLGSKGTAWTIAGDDPTLYNEAGEPRVRIVEKPVSFDGCIEVPRYSVTLLRLPHAAE